MLCRHCQRKEANRPRGLCWSCYYTPGVSELYPSTSKFNGFKNAADEKAERNHKKDRKPGEPPYRCLWCLKWRCHERMRLCGSCQAEYERAKVGMPRDGQPEVNGCAPPG